jgi:hypothetical protein
MHKNKKGKKGYRESLWCIATSILHLKTTSSSIWPRCTPWCCACLHHTSQYHSWRWEARGHYWRKSRSKCGCSATVQEPENSPDQNVPLERVLEKDTSIRDQSTHRWLKNDFIEHIWNKFGGRRHISGVWDRIHVIVLYFCIIYIYAWCTCKCLNAHCQLFWFLQGANLPVIIYLHCCLRTKVSSRNLITTFIFLTT